MLYLKEALDTKMSGAFCCYSAGLGDDVAGGFVAGEFVPGALVAGTVPRRAWKRGSSRRGSKRGSIPAEMAALVPPRAMARLR
jgi:hypothetical protein